MANISNFDGDLVITGADKASVVAVSNVIVETMAKWDYGFYAFPEEISEKDVYFSRDEFLDGEYRLEYQAAFSGEGSGRWTFGNNVEFLGRWLLEELKGSEKLKVLEQHSFVLQFMGTDIEVGCGVFDSLTGTFFHKKGDPLKDSTVNVDCQSKGEITVDALMEHYGWDEEEAKAYLGLE